MDSTKLEDYIIAKAILKSAKADELALRKEILEELFPVASEGIQTTLQGDYVAKGGFKLSYKVNNDEFEDGVLDGSISPEMQDCVVYKPSLSMTAYKNLSAEDRETLDGYLTIKPALPSLTVELQD